ncbi:DNA polymerase [Pasteurella phage PHB01]|uniref:DNA polymerase n=1 Tax=Pasteurella phage PHB01 TaxID=2006930 RepID=A0A218M4E1_9CAUD|nr:DNA polymerase I [Pasteurella phage PHB01]ASD51034.1 DNA polymerase [Pasteurella phage PHB01]
MIISDIEANGLLDTVSRFHCAVTYDTATGETKKYRPTDFEVYLRDLEKVVTANGLVTFHNGYKYDIQALNILAKQYGIKWSGIPQRNSIDTLVLSRLIYSDIKDRDMGLLRSGKIQGTHFGSHGLEAWGYRLGEMKGEYKYDFKERIESEGEEYIAGMEWEHFSEEMLEYNVQDVVVTTKLMERLMAHKWYSSKVEGLDWKTCNADDFWSSHGHSFTLEHEAAWLLSKQERNGFPFDRKGIETLYIELSSKRAELTQKLVEMFGSWYRPKGGKEFFKHPKTGVELVKYPKVIYPKIGSMFLKPKNKAQREGIEPLEKSKTPYIKGCPYTPVEHVTFNPSSREHIALKLQEAGWTPTEFTDKGSPVVNDETLDSVIMDDPKKQAAIDLIKEYLMIQKRIGQVAEGDKAWLKYDQNGYIHGSVNPNGAVTGRATHSFPNLAQIPSAPHDKQGNPIMGLTGKYGVECRMAFGAEHHKGSDGKAWIQVGTDASGLELRCLGHYMYPFDNGEYIDVILEGDIHTKNQIAAGLPTRDNAKTFIYGFLYGAGDAKIGEIVQGTAADGKRLKAKFLENTPAIKMLRDSITNALVAESKWVGNQNIIKWKRRYIKGLDGRMVHIRSPHSALNTLLQSAGALICKEWIVEVEKLLLASGLKHGWDGDFAYMAWVHDEIQVACRTQEVAEKVADISQQAMRNVQNFYNFRCQLDTESKIGRNWAECH